MQTLLLPGKYKSIGKGKTLVLLKSQEIIHALLIKLKQLA